VLKTNGKSMQERRVIRTRTESLPCQTEREQKSWKSIHNQKKNLDKGISSVDGGLKLRTRVSSAEDVAILGRRGSCGNERIFLGGKRGVCTKNTKLIVRKTVVVTRGISRKISKRLVKQQKNITQNEKGKGQKMFYR